MASRIRYPHLRHPAVLLSTACGAGLSPWAPGTMGTLVALPVWWWLLAPLALPAYLLVLVSTVLLGWWVSARTISLVGLDASDHEQADDGAIVIDEVAGVWLALMLAPHSWWAMLAGFVLFRLFDIAKPWPVSWADRRLPGAWGVMADDLIAGLQAMAVLAVLLWAVAFAGF
jgi:phosphatidylglycerophosphatase A